MVLVINLNASIDKRYRMADFRKGEVMRVREVDNTPGGKGIHVANVLGILGEDCLATGFLGGRSGEFIKDRLQEYGIRHDFVDIQGETRSCIAVVDDEGCQTELLEPGPLVSNDEQERFLGKYAELLAAAQVVVASGSLPGGVDKGFYGRLVSLARRSGDKPVLLDTSGEALLQGIEEKPYFIKPNQDELAALLGHDVQSEGEIADAVRGFLAKGIALVAVSMGADGCMAGYDGRICKVSVPKIKCKNPVGSGDSFVAGIAAGMMRGMGIEDTLKLAAACGTANALEDESGFVRRENVEKLFGQIEVEWAL